jgi:hypothetical protein
MYRQEDAAKRRAPAVDRSRRKKFHENTNRNNDGND